MCECFLLENVMSSFLQKTLLELFAALDLADCIDQVVHHSEFHLKVGMRSRLTLAAALA
jgi:hypothetical protein